LVDLGDIVDIRNKNHLNIIPTSVPNIHIADMSLEAFQLRRFATKAQTQAILSCLKQLFE
jgi:hypothetical protein